MSVRIALVVAAALALLVTACGSGNGGNDGGGVPQVTVPPGTVGSQHVLGSPEAPLELIEYADFQ